MGREPRGRQPKLAGAVLAAQNSAILSGEIWKMVLRQTAMRNRHVLEDALASVRGPFDQVLGEIGDTLEHLQTGYSVEMRTLLASNTLGAVRRDGLGEARFTFEARIVVSQLVIRVTNGERAINVLRTDAADPRFDDAYADRLRLFILEGIQGLFREPAL